MEMLKEFLMSGAATIFYGIILGYGFKVGVEYIKKSKNKVDDKALELGVDVLVDVLNEYDLGQVETILKKALIKAELIDEDTTEIEQALNKKLDDVSKK